MSEPKPVALGIIRNSSGKILVSRRIAGKLLGGWWEFPGGKLDYGETHEVALKRELKEELGIDVTVLDLYACTTTHWDHGSFALRYYNCSVTDGQIPTPLGCERFVFSAPIDLLELNFLPFDTQLIQRLISEHNILTHFEIRIVVKDGILNLCSEEKLLQDVEKALGPLNVTIQYISVKKR